MRKPRTPEHKAKVMKNLVPFKQGFDSRRSIPVISGNRKDYFRNRDLKRKFGISLIEYEELLEKQNYRCAICGGYQMVKGNNLYVDHDHSTVKIRGLLCHYCNVGIGMMKDNEKILENAIQYLRLTK